MLALHSLRNEYTGYVNEFTLDRRQAANTTLDNITESCNVISSPLYHETTPAACTVDRSGPPSKPARDTTNNTNPKPPPPPPPPPNLFIAIGKLSDWAIKNIGR